MPPCFISTSPPFEQGPCFARFEYLPHNDSSIESSVRCNGQRSASCPLFFDDFLGASDRKAPTGYRSHSVRYSTHERVRGSMGKRPKRSSEYHPAGAPVSLQASSLDPRHRHILSLIGRQLLLLLLYQNLNDSNEEHGIRLSSAPLDLYKVLRAWGML